MAVYTAFLTAPPGSLIGYVGAIVSLSRKSFCRKSCYP